MAEHAVIVHVPLSGDWGTEGERAALFRLEDELTSAIANADAGELDGNEFGGGECVFFTYGPDAERLFAAIRPVLDAHDLPAGSAAVLRWGEAGGPNAREERRSLR